MQFFCISEKIGFMKATLSIPGRGLIALPAKMREAFGIRPQDNLIAETTLEGVLLRLAMSVPIEIYSEERIGCNGGFAAQVGRLRRAIPTLGFRGALSWYGA